MVSRPWLVLVSPDEATPAAVARLEGLLPALAPAADLVVLRWREGSSRSLLAAATRLAAVQPRPRLVLRDRVDLARCAGLDGVHLGEDGLGSEIARRLWPDGLVGVSRHDRDGVARRSAGADYVLVAPVHPTSTKPGQPGGGLDLVREAVAATSVPVLGLGGIDAERVGAVLRVGAFGVAVRSAVFGAADPGAAARELRRALDSTAPRPPDDEFVSGPDGGVRPE